MVNQIYTFVRGANIPADVKVGDKHTWKQLRPNVGSYPGRPSGPPKTITGTVVEIENAAGTDWVLVEGPRVGTPEEDNE